MKDRAMKLLEIINVMDIKEHQQVWPTSFFVKKQDQE